MKHFKKTAQYLFFMQIALVFSASLVPFFASAQTVYTTCPAWGCQYSPTVNYTSLAVSCYSNYSGNIPTNTNVNWYAVVSGGNGLYTYSWNGTDGIAGSNSSVSMPYASLGTKTASVSVSSAGQIATANCGNVNIYQPSSDYYYYNPNSAYYPNPALSGACSVSGDTAVGSAVTWSASASGGNGIYNFYWSGDDSLSATVSSISKIYNYPGTKNAMVTITSNGQTITRNCSVNVLANNYVNTGTVYTSTPVNTGTTNQVLAYSATNPNLQSVYLSNVPYTGAGDDAKVIGFLSIILLWSAGLSYIFLKRKEQEQLLVVAESTDSNNKNLQSNISANYSILESIEAIARNNKVILSSEAVIKIAKLKELKKIDPSELMEKISKGEWMTCGEKDIESYI